MPLHFKLALQTLEQRVSLLSGGHFSLLLKAQYLLRLALQEE
jgi:hypothetical protein